MPALRTLIDRLTGQQRLSHTEILLSGAGVLIAITLVAFISQRFLSGLALPFVVASMGASAVLLFAVPSSPMNRPWAVAIGHLSSAIIGVTCAQQIGELLIAVPVAAAGATLVMRYLRCLHPPGGATAMLIVLGGDQIHAAGYQFVLTPVALNVLVLLCTALAIRFINLRMQKPEKQEITLHWIDELEASRPLAPHLTQADLETARTQLDTYIDVMDEELLKLLRFATHNMHQRRLGELRCRELMLPKPLCAVFDSSLDEVWGWFQQHRLTAVPVIDQAYHVIGIITLKDFIHHAAAFPQPTLELRIKALIQGASGKGKVVGQLMTSPVIAARESDKVAELLPLLDNRHIHHIPIVDANGKLTGLLSRSEIVAILDRDEKLV